MPVELANQDAAAKRRSSDQLEVGNDGRLFAGHGQVTARMEPEVPWVGARPGGLRSLGLTVSAQPAGPKAPRAVHLECPAGPKAPHDDGLAAANTAGW